MLLIFLKPYGIEENSGLSGSFPLDQEGLAFTRIYNKFDEVQHSEECPEYLHKLKYPSGDHNETLCPSSNEQGQFVKQCI